MINWRQIETSYPLTAKALEKYISVNKLKEDSDSINAFMKEHFPDNWRTWKFDLVEAKLHTSHQPEQLELFNKK
jgi:hypothetical protein